MEGIFPSLLSPFKQFTLLLIANDLPNGNPFKINFRAVRDRALVSKTARPFQQGKFPAQKPPAPCTRSMGPHRRWGSDDGSVILPASTSESEIWFASRVAPVV
jgi:hypothetical protein